MSDSVTTGGQPIMIGRIKRIEGAMSGGIDRAVIVGRGILRRLHEANARLLIGSATG